MNLTIRKYDLTNGLCEGAVSSIVLGTCQTGIVGRPYVFDLSIDGVGSISSVKMKLAGVGTDNAVPSGASGLCDDGLFAVSILESINPAAEFISYFCGIGSVVDIPMKSGFLSKYIHLAVSPKASRDSVSSAAFEFLVDYTGGDPSVTASSSSMSSSSSSSSNNPESSSFSYSSGEPTLQCGVCHDALDSYLVHIVCQSASACGGCMSCDIDGVYEFVKISPCVYFDSGGLGGNGILWCEGGTWNLSVSCVDQPCLLFTSNNSSGVPSGLYDYVESGCSCSSWSASVSACEPTLQCGVCHDALDSYLVHIACQSASACGGCMSCDIDGVYEFVKISPCVYSDSGGLGGNGILWCEGGTWNLSVSCVDQPCLLFTSNNSSGVPSGLVYDYVESGCSCSSWSVSVSA